MAFCLPNTQQAVWKSTYYTTEGNVGGHKSP